MRSIFIANASELQLYSIVMREIIKLVSTAGTGYTYYTTKNKRTQTAKLELRKYDPIIRQHVVFKEAKVSHQKGK